MRFSSSTCFYEVILKGDLLGSSWTVCSVSVVAQRPGCRGSAQINKIAELWTGFLLRHVLQLEEKNSPPGMFKVKVKTGF